MPVSAEMNKNKTKSKTEALCLEVDAMIAKAQKQVNAFAKVKENLEFEPGLLKKAVSMKLGSEEDIKQVASDMKAWKTEVKSDVKADVMAKKKELRAARKERRKTLQEPVVEKQTKTRKKKSRGGFI